MLFCLIIYKSFVIAVDFLREAVRLPGIQFAPTDQGETVTTDFGIVTASTIRPPSSLSEGLTIVKDASDFITAFAYEISQHKCFDRETSGLASRVAF